MRRTTWSSPSRWPSCWPGSRAGAADGRLGDVAGRSAVAGSRVADRDRRRHRVSRRTVASRGRTARGDHVLTASRVHPAQLMAAVFGDADTSRSSTPMCATCAGNSVSASSTPFTASAIRSGRSGPERRPPIFGVSTRRGTAAIQPPRPLLWCCSSSVASGSPSISGYRPPRSTPSWCLWRRRRTTLATRHPEWSSRSGTTAARQPVHMPTRRRRFFPDRMDWPTWRSTT